MLSLRVVARPLREVMLMFNDTNAARGGIGKVERRGLCGDVYLVGAPAGARIGDVKVDTSVRKGQITFSAALENLAPHTRYTLRAAITDRGHKVREFTSKTLRSRRPPGRPLRADREMEARETLGPAHAATRPRGGGVVG